jgi:hypothetical protein
MMRLRNTQNKPYNILAIIQENIRVEGAVHPGAAGQAAPGGGAQG